MKISTIGFDLAKTIFAVHGSDEAGAMVAKRTLRRSQVLGYFARFEPCLVGMEASSGAHYWARELMKLGHEVRLMPAGYVKAYVKRGKTDAADAEAICEAVRRPTMRFVPVKGVESQGVLTLHRARDLLVRQRTQTTNVVRALCAEFGLVAAQGRLALAGLAAMIADNDDARLPAAARLALKPLLEQVDRLTREIAHLEREIVLRHRENEAGRRLATIPGIGPITASALIAAVGDVKRFVSGRDLAAWLGLTPQPRSSGGKNKLGRISKMGDPYLRRLLVQGTSSDVGRTPKESPGVSLASRADGAPADQGRSGRACQQNGKDRLGSAHKWRGLSSARQHHRKRRMTRLRRKNLQG